MNTPDNKPRKSILKTDADEAFLPSFGQYNLYAKRASFKEDVVFQKFCKPEEPLVSEDCIQETLPIAPDEMEADLSPEEAERRRQFKDKRKHLALEGADGIDVKAALAHKLEPPTIIRGYSELEDEEINTSTDLQQFSQSHPSTSQSMKCDQEVAGADLSGISLVDQSRSTSSRHESR